MSDSENQSSIVSFTTGLGGDVDLSVGNKIYRVQRDILSDKSEIFAGLFAKALLEVHGSDHKSPVIPLPEKSQPFELFLRAIYEHDLDTCLPKYARDTTRIIADILDIATRYKVAKALFLEKFTPFIVRDWPDTLDGWDAIEIYAAQLRETIEETHQCPAENDELPEPASAIHFACLYAEGDALPSYVPAAFYQLARTPILGDLDAIATSEWDFNGGRTAKFWILTPRVMLCLHHGTNNLRRLTAEIAFRGFVSAAEGDLNASQDEKAAMIEWWRNIGIKQLSGHYRAYWPVLDPLTDLKDLADLLVNDSVEEPPGFYESDSDSDPHCEFVDDSDTKG
ncbi:hypothetical protein H0H92_002741 [Tricholoma furcatifolium]|nr:hypothetical protein H0H92_002741 [Tricholoma furcatifolium]